MDTFERMVPDNLEETFERPNLTQDNCENDDGWQRIVEDALSSGPLSFLEPIEVDRRRRSEWPSSYSDSEQRAKTSKKCLVRLADRQDEQYNHEYGESDETQFDTFSGFSDLIAEDRIDAAIPSSIRTLSVTSTSLASELENNLYSSLDTPETFISQPDHEMKLVPLSNPSSYDFQNHHPSLSSHVCHSKKHLPNLSEETLLQKRPRESNTSFEAFSGYGCPEVPFSVSTTVVPRKDGSGTTFRTSWYPAERDAKSVASEVGRRVSQWKRPRTLREFCKSIISEDNEADGDHEAQLYDHVLPYRLSLPKVSMLQIDHPSFTDLLSDAEESTCAASPVIAEPESKNDEPANVAHTTTSPFRHRWVYSPQTITLKQKPRPQVLFLPDSDFSSVFNPTLAGLGKAHP